MPAAELAPASQHTEPALRCGAATARRRDGAVKLVVQNHTLGTRFEGRLATRCGPPTSPRRPLMVEQPSRTIPSAWTKTSSESFQLPRAASDDLAFAASALAEAIAATLGRYAAGC